MSTETIAIARLKRSSWVLGLSLCVASCAEDPCHNAEYFLAGFCVVENGYVVSPAHLELPVEAVESALAERDIYIPDGLARDLEAHGYVRLEYVSADSVFLDNGSGNRNWGLIHANRYIFIDGDAHFRDGTDARYFVLGHELIHYVAAVHLGVSAATNASHFSKDLFTYTYHINGMAAPDTVVEVLMENYLFDRLTKE